MQTNPLQKKEKAKRKSTRGREGKRNRNEREAGVWKGLSTQIANQPIQTRTNQIKSRE
jgi:hypothetical protein